MQDEPPIDADALRTRLEAISPTSTAPTTPPPDLEADKEQFRLLEEQAREDLEKDGCPPYYSADPTFLVQDSSAQHKETMPYWEVFPTTEGGVFCAQRKDWKAFRKFQEKNRRHYLQLKTFTEFENKVRERRRKHQLDGDVCLHSDPTQQGLLETWIEFQDYHLQIHDGLEKEAQIEREKLDTARTKLERADSSEAGHAALHVETYEVRWASARSKLKSHGEILLRWIEQHRIVMVATKSISANDTGSRDDEVDTIQRAPARHRQKRKPKARSLLSPVQSGVSKPAPQKRSPRRQKPEVPQEAENVPADLGTSQISISCMPNLRESKSRSAKNKMPLRPFRPQKVTKTAKKAFEVESPKDIEANLPARRSAQQHPSKVFKTRSGRKSRRPEQLGFVSHG